jgi:quercetin dioxygenase-like cupin family protein
MMDTIPFQTTDWKGLPATRREGETGFALWRTLQYGDLRVRLVEYSPGYRANHWCELGHVLLCLEGELETELADGSSVKLKPGMSYQVTDGASSHRSATATGAKLFIVDGRFLKPSRSPELELFGRWN